MSPATGRGASRVLAGLSDRAFGVAFLLVLAAAIALAIASYAKVFVPVVRVTLEAGRAGNQMQELSDVKLRGVLVGEVRSISSDGDGATMELALDPDHVAMIPADVEARLLPKTLFGEKFVSLVVPDEPADRHIRAGDVIPQDRSATAIELEQVLDDLLPLLQAVRPQDLALTLGALSTALEGRGERIGENVTLVGDYLTEINPRMDLIQSDVSALADVVSLYADAAPDLLRILRSQSVTTATIVQEQDTLAQFLAGTAGFARTADQVLTENESRIIRVGEVSRPTLEVLARYSPIYRCFAEGLVAWEPRVRDTFADEELHITLEVVPQRPAYQPGEEPRFDDTSGPDCQGLPAPGGSQQDPYPGKVTDDGSNGGGDTYAFSAVPTAFDGPSTGLVGSRGERLVVGSLVGPQMGLEPEQVPDIATLLFGPVARGTEVNQ
jgi:phospholipid/cholesterol/gamma-HCH transport system substrate-binding protein